MLRLVFGQVPDLEVGVLVGIVKCSERLLSTPSCIHIRSSCPAVQRYSIMSTDNLEEMVDEQVLRHLVSIT